MNIINLTFDTYKAVKNSFDSLDTVECLKIESLTANIGFAKKRASWWFEHSTSHQLLGYSCNFDLRNPLLRKAKNRYSILNFARFRLNFPTIRKT